MSTTAVPYLPAVSSRSVATVIPLTSGGNAGSFSLSAGTILKGKAKSRSSAAQFPIFSQLSSFIIDTYWADWFRKIARNDLPPGFSINGDAMICRKNNRTLRLYLIYSGINQMNGLEGLNPELSQILQQIYIPPAEVMTPGGALTSTLRSITLTSVRVNQVPINSKPIPQEWMVMQVTEFGHYYLAPEFLATSIGLVLQYFIISVIQFLREHGNHNSPADTQRQEATRIYAPNMEVAWDDLDSETQNEKYRNYIDRLAERAGYTGWDRDRFISHMRQYRYCNGIQSNCVFMQGGQIVEIYGIDFSQGWPVLKGGKSGGSGSHTQSDAAVKHWHKYWQAFPVTK